MRCGRYAIIRQAIRFHSSGQAEAYHNAATEEYPAYSGSHPEVASAIGPLVTGRTRFTEVDVHGDAYPVTAEEWFS